MKHRKIVNRNLLSEANIYRLLFIVLFFYAILRALLVVPMLDEISTFFSYIRTGNYFNNIERIDANNHILTSFFGHQFYRVFGDTFFLFWLSSVLAFPVYFFSVKYIVHRSISNPMRMFVFLALVCVPWIFEYFSYARGYALALSLFFAAIAFVMKWQASQNWKYLVGIFICAWATIASNLAYMLPIFILVGYTVLLFLIRRDFTKSKTIRFVGMLILWGLAMIPLFRYSLKLKEAGALWWGNQNGLWESTGTSVSKLVLFTDTSWVLYLVLIVLIACAVVFFVRWIKIGFLSYLKEGEALLFILLIMALVGIETMRRVLDVNYPMDRVAMYLVPLFILSFGILISRVKVLKYSTVVLLFFPASFVVYANLSTSIFSPEDRIPVSFTDFIKGEITENDALSAEHVSHVSYAFSCRDDKKVHMAYTDDGQERNYANYHISWLEGRQLDNYSVLDRHPDSKTGFMKRDKDIKRELVLDTVIRAKKGSDLYFTTLKRPIDSTLMNELLQIRLSAEMDFDNTSRGFNFVQTIRDANNNVIDAYSPVFNWYFSDRKDINFVFMDRPFRLKPEATDFHFFWVNNDQVNVNVTFIRVEVFRIVNPNP